MRHEDWIAAFAERAGIGSRDQAERSAVHIVGELGGCLTWGEAHNLAGQMPEPLAGALRDGSQGTAMARFSARAYVARVAERDGIGPKEARRRVVAFLETLREELPSRELEPLEEELASWQAELPL